MDIIIKAARKISNLGSLALLFYLSLIESEGFTLSMMVTHLISGKMIKMFKAHWYLGTLLALHWVGCRSVDCILDIHLLQKKF